MTLYLHGIGHCHPHNIIDNKFLESLDIETNDAWIMERVGIVKRHTVLSLDYIKKTYNNPPCLQGKHIEINNTEMSCLAIQDALKRSKLQSNQIGMIIAGSCCPEYSLPADACVIAAGMNLIIPAFDVNSACTTFISHLCVINAMEAEKLPDYILLVICDTTTRHINYKDRSTCVLWGDCATAVIVSKKIESNTVIDNITFESNPSNWEKIILPAGGYFSQQGNIVQKFAVNTTINIVNKITHDAKLQNDQFYFIAHQANMRMLQYVCKKINVSDEKHLFNVDQYGNCGAASAPSVLSENYDRFKPGDLIVMAVVGAGFTWGSLLIRIL